MPSKSVPLGADYIVVGAGSAGCAVASRLSEDPSVSVVLLEAGGWDERPEIHRADAASVLSLLTAEWRSEIDWGYVTESEAGMEGRRVPVARGKVVGGCSSVNALMWVRGSRHDYTRWVAEGATGWSYDDVLPFFRQAEDYSGGADAFRGAGGPVRVRQLDRPAPIARAFVAGAGELGYATDTDGDYNGARQEGFGFLYQTFRDDAGHRCSTADAYLRPSLERSNLTVLTGTLVTRLLLAGTQVTGVEYVQDGTRRQLRAEGEVIVSAGAFETPKLLMLSGIGPAAHLREHGIRCVQDLPGVGAGLQDHLFVPICYQSLQEHPDGALLSEAGLFTHTREAGPEDSPTSSSPSVPSSSCRPTPPPTSGRGPDSPSRRSRCGRRAGAGYGCATAARSPTPSSAPATSPPRPTSMSWCTAWSWRASWPPPVPSTRSAATSSAPARTSPGPRSCAGTSPRTRRPCGTRPAPAGWARARTPSRTPSCACTASRGYGSRTRR